MIEKITIVKEQSGTVVNYGLEIHCNNKILNYKNITSEITEIEQLKLQLLRDEISESHINDVIRDFIMGKACDRLILNGIS